MSITLTCDRCKKPIKLDTIHLDGVAHQVVFAECTDHWPVATIRCSNPRRLGIITSITEGEDK